MSIIAFKQDIIIYLSIICIAFIATDANSKRLRYGIILSNTVLFLSFLMFSNNKTSTHFLDYMIFGMVIPAVLIVSNFLLKKKIPSFYIGVMFGIFAYSLFKVVYNLT